MMTSVFLVIGKILLMFILIGGMIMVLMSIGHLFHNDDLNTSEDDRQLRDDVENSKDVVSDKSVFYNFLVREQKDEDKRRRG